MNLLRDIDQKPWQLYCSRPIQALFVHIRLSQAGYRRSFFIKTFLKPYDHFHYNIVLSFFVQSIFRSLKEEAVR